MKARKVKGLDPDAPFAAAAERIARVRSRELDSFWPAVRDPDAIEALHDMRIAAKRVRYVLELAAPALGPDAKDRAKQARAIQDILGEIHDCDVILPLVKASHGLTQRFRARRQKLHAEFLDAYATMKA